MPALRKLAVATGGGDCPGLNAVIRAVVLRARALGIEVLGVEDGLNGLMAGTSGSVRALGVAEVKSILARGGMTPEAIIACSIGRTFSSMASSAHSASAVCRAALALASPRPASAITAAET